MPSRTQAPTQAVDPRAQQAAGPPAGEAATQPVARQSRPARRRTLWEEGTHPGPLVIRAAILALLAVTLLSLLVGNRIGIVFDIAFVLICVGAALWVHPKDFFSIGVLPPLLLGVAVTALAIVDRVAVAKPHDPLVQAVVSGLAHHSLALAIGYTLTLLILALRQVALRNRGTLRPRGHSTN